MCKFGAYVSRDGENAKVCAASSSNIECTNLQHISNGTVDEQEKDQFSESATSKMNRVVLVIAFSLLFMHTSAITRPRILERCDRCDHSLRRMESVLAGDYKPFHVDTAKAFHDISCIIRRCPEVDQVDAGSTGISNVDKNSLKPKAFPSSRYNCSNCARRDYRCKAKCRPRKPYWF